MVTFDEVLKWNGIHIPIFFGKRRFQEKWAEAKASFEARMGYRMYYAKQWDEEGYGTILQNSWNRRRSYEDIVPITMPVIYDPEQAVPVLDNWLLTSAYQAFIEYDAAMRREWLFEIANNAQGRLIVLKESDFKPTELQKEEFQKNLKKRNPCYIKSGVGDFKFPKWAVINSSAVGYIDFRNWNLNPNNTSVEYF